MKILQLCHKPPVPSKDGGCIAMKNITQGLLEDGHQVKVLSIHTYKHPFLPEDIPQEFLQSTQMEAVYVNTKLDLVEAFSNLVTRDPYNISRFFSPDMDRKLIEVLEADDYAIVHLESLFMTPYIETIRRVSSARIVLRSHNLEYVIWKRMANGEENFAKKAYLKILADQLKKYELETLENLDGIAAISSEDANSYKELGCSVPVRTIPFGINISNLEPIAGEEQKNGKPQAIFHLGSMDWMPNEEGVRWLLEKVWPLVHEAQPDLVLKLAGRNMPVDLFGNEFPNVEVIGEVPDAAQFMRENGVMVVPLLSAGGIRVKIIEGMALGKTIVSTKIGADGIDYTDEKEILIANDAEGFAKKIHQATKDDALNQSLNQNARRLIEDKYSNTRVIQNLVKFYEDLLEEKVTS